MPELPEMEVVKDVLQARIVKQTICDVEVVRPLVLRDLTSEGFVAGLQDRCILEVVRRGKVLVLDLSGGRSLAINPMLSGRLQLCAAHDRRLPYTQLVLRLSSGLELRYADRRSMGKLYLTDDLASLPGWTEMGPDALDPQLTLERFAERLKGYRGEVKSVLVNPRFIAGIGNAYADEICFRAGIYPFRKRGSLSAGETQQLYRAMRRTLVQAIGEVRRQMGEEIHTKPREFLSVHGKGGQPCPRCGGPISEITARQRPTNFCRRCQPGSLIRR